MLAKEELYIISNHTEPAIKILIEKIVYQTTHVSGLACNSNRHVLQIQYNDAFYLATDNIKTAPARFRQKRKYVPARNVIS